MKPGQPPKPLHIRLDAGVKDAPADGCWVWQGKCNNKGYGVLRMAGRDLFAHRLAYEAVFGPIPDGLNVLHACDNPPCIFPFHLSAGTLSENSKQAVERGRLIVPRRDQRGEANAIVKLSDMDVLEIRRLCASGERQQDIADRFSIGNGHVSQIKNRKLWSHI